jgi:type II secretory pathway pseudopilin PulG
MLCPNCKNEIENNAVFCEHCGARVKKSKKWLWITLSVILMSVIATIVIITIQEQKAMEQDRVEQSKLELEQQLQAERIAKEEAEHQAEIAGQREARWQELLSQGFVDLGLPSGTFWKNANEGGDYARYTYVEALRKFGNKLPTNQQLVELKNECEWTWFGDGYMVTGPNGNSIYLPAAGYRYCDGVVYGVGTYGDYWSSTLCNTDLAWHLGFNSGKVSEEFDDLCYGQSVRLVMNP